ncbi:hypothetical protein ACF0H5_007267 [Mactra antiquata]
MNKCFKNACMNWCFKGSSTILSVFIILILIDIIQPCTQVIQKCQNCFPNPLSGCDNEYDGSSVPECLTNLDTTGVTVIAYNDDYPSTDSRRCWVYNCAKTWRRSCCGSTSYRYGCAESGCTNVTLTSYNSVIIDSGISPVHTISSSSSTECMSYCIDMAYTGTSCSSSYKSGNCSIYTGCPSGGCTRTSSSYASVDVAVCDGAPLSACSLLTPPTNGVITFSDNYNINSIASYSCETGYALSVGSLSITCTASGEWSAVTAPTCDPDVPTTCSTLNAPTNGTVTLSDSYNVGSVAYYGCDTGYSLSSTLNKTCLASGQWSAPNDPTCDLDVPTTCSTLNAPTNGTVTLSDSYNVGSVAYYGCDTGYSLSSTLNKTCLASGQWSAPNDPTCDLDVPTTCSTLNAPTNGTVTLSDSYNVGSVAYYGCDTGYVLSNSNNKTCSASGQWSPANNPSCDLIVSCSPLTAPGNGSVSYSDDYNQGSRAIYSCNSGFILTNFTSKECTSTGMWSTLLDPVCVPEDSIPKPSYPMLYIMPCICYVNSSFTGLTEEEIIEQLIKDTKIDETKTALSQQKLISAEDPRASSKIIGSVGIALISVILGFCVLIDCLSLFQKFCSDDDK